MSRKPEYCRDLEEISECFLCPNLCKLKDDEKGKCLSRWRKDGQMSLLSYAQIVAGGIDPIEKKPLYHVAPGMPIFSVGSFGCNLKCRFCQNSNISQNIQPAREMLPQTLVDYAASIKDNIGVAFTYNEPGIWFEYICDCADLLKAKNLLSIMVTNGFLCHEPWQKLCTKIDAMNIDLKAFTSSFYKDICQGDLETVKRNIKIAYESGVYIELTNLVVTGLNDNEQDFQQMVEWIASISKDIPLHISRYFPQYKETAPATAVNTLVRFEEIARQSLNYVYLGNVAGESDTYCPSCGELWVKRMGYSTERLIFADKCKCGLDIPIVNRKEPTF